VRLLRNCLWIGLVALACLVAIHFPYITDAEPSAQETAKVVTYYQQAYSAMQSADTGEAYMKVAEDVAEGIGVKGTLQDYIRTHDLSGKRALDVGSGRGYLQDVVPDYTGLDISPSAQRFYHKPFVLGSATALPFPDNRFDIVWSIWVLEHIPNPEQALREMRRVTRDGGIIYLMPAWFCPTWAAQGYEIRPYSDFGLTGKLIKASIPLRSQLPFIAAYLLPARAIRFLSYEISRSPTRLHYRRLQPNYTKYWVPDSDATSSIAWYEALLWFDSRRDQVLNHDTPAASIVQRVKDPRLIVQVHKQ
jgi:ubiquinone/menaquinone biosynthesis C-methylase UbiE